MDASGKWGGGGSEWRGPIPAHLSLISTHQSFLHSTLTQLYILMDRNGTAYSRTSIVQHNNLADITPTFFAVES